MVRPKRQLPGPLSRVISALRSTTTAFDHWSASRNLASAVNRRSIFSGSAASRVRIRISNWSSRSDSRWIRRWRSSPSRLRKARRNAAWASPARLKPRLWATAAKVRPESRSVRASSSEPRRGREGGLDPERSWRPSGPRRSALSPRLGRTHRLGLGTLLSGLRLELHPLALYQLSIAGTLDRRKVDEHVRRAVVGC